MHIFRAFVLLVSFGAIALGDPRTPIKGTPLIVDRDIPLFVLTEQLRVDRSAPGMRYNDLADRVLCDVLPGLFMPVSQDAKGVYYQGSNGVRRLLRGGWKKAGGVYVSKTKADAMFVYEGDAENTGARLILDTFRLSGQQAGKFKIGKPAGGRGKKR